MRYGVSETMIETYGNAIFNLSLNKQKRTGDPVRLMDFEAIERQRADTGLTDTEIALRTGLVPEQVRLIRTIVEQRKFRPNQHRKLFNLGGGKRYRVGRYVDVEDEYAMSRPNAALENSLNFDPGQVAKYVEQGLWGNHTLSQWLSNHARSRADAPALIHPEGDISYSELADKVKKLSYSLSSLGLGRGDIVACMLPNTVEFLVSYLAVTSFGGVFQTIHMPYRENDIEFLLGHSKARAVICLAKLKDFDTSKAMLSIQKKCKNLKHIITLGDGGKGTVLFSQLAEGAGDSPSGPQPTGGDPFLLLYTSGTTSNPKGVPLTYNNMLSNARVSVDEFSVTSEDRIISAAPFSHLYGLFNFHLALCVGAASVLMPVFTPPDFAKIVKKQKPTMLFLGPAHVSAMMNAGLIDSDSFGSVRFSVFSGATCPPELMRQYQNKVPSGVTAQLWGMTETAGGCYTRPDDSIEISSISSGRAAPGNEVRVVDDNGKPCAPGVAGELQIRGCSIFPGYLDNEQANQEAFAENGWFKTGDLATIDTNGCMSITGRSKDLINRGGVKYNPADIEQLLATHPKVSEVSIVPMPDEVLGEKACCFVVAMDEAPTLEELCSLLKNEKVAKTKWPERLKVIEEMPITPTRKVIKGKLQALL